MENPAVNPSVSAINAAPEKWRALLNQFEEVLNLNIFIADPQGHVVLGLSSCGQSGNFGASFLKKTFAFKIAEDKRIVLADFEPEKDCLCVIDPFELRVFAVAVNAGFDSAQFYLIVGPIILGESWSEDKYSALARQLGLDDKNFLENIRGVPRMSPLAVNAILDLLGEVVGDVLEVEVEKQKLQSAYSAGQALRPEIINAAKDILVSIQQDELLISILDNAIKMANAEGGSILLFDETTQEFVMRVSRGLENKKNIMQARIKIGEGISGLAAESKKPLFIKGTQSDARLRPFLKRPEIKQSIVIPLLAGEKVIGVLNLCTKSQGSEVAYQHVETDVRQLSRFIVTALQSL